MKSWYLSRTVWLGGLSITLAGITASTSGDASWQSIAIAAIGAATVYPRTQTNGPLTK